MCGNIKNGPDSQRVYEQFNRFLGHFEQLCFRPFVDSTTCVFRKGNLAIRNDKLEFRKDKKYLGRKN